MLRKVEKMLNNEIILILIIISMLNLVISLKANGINRIPGISSKSKLLMSLSPTKPEITKMKDSRPSNPESGAYSFDQWKKAFHSQPTEFLYTLNSNDIEGIIPSDLNGNLYRNMPALFERGGNRVGHYLDGDGYITKMDIDGKTNTVRFTSKFVQTPEFIQETLEDKILYRSTFRTQRKSYAFLTGGLIDPNNFMDLKLKNLANTNVIQWGNRLLALYEAGVPISMDKDTLDTIGSDNLNVDEIRPNLALAIPALKAALPNLHDKFIGGSYFTAHPKIDLLRNKMIGFSYRAEVDADSGDRVTTVRVREWDESMQASDAVIHPLTSSTGGAPHDFSVTENYYCFIENRLEGDINQYILGNKTPAECLRLSASQPMILNLVPRPNTSAISSDDDKKKEVIRVELGPGFTIHSPCAFENNQGNIELYTTAWDSQAVKNGAAKGGLLGNWEGTAPDFEDIPLTLLYKTIVNPTTGELISHAPVIGLESTVVEHPHIDPRQETTQVNYLYMSLGSITGTSSPPVGYQRVDLLTGELQRWFAPVDTFCEELVVVPKSNNNNDSNNSVNSDGSDVWLLAAMFDARENKSLIGILDGADITKGPVARIWMSHALPHSLHGCFVSE